MFKTLSQHGFICRWINRAEVKKESDDMQFQNSSEIKLLNCPCCGGKAEISDKKFIRGHFVYCTECGIQTKLYTTGNTTEKAVNDWNTRKPMEQVLTRLEDMATHYYQSYQEYENKVSLGMMRGFRESMKIVEKEGKS